MEFGWINVWGAVIVVLMLIPNIVYAIKFKGENSRCHNRFLIICEQIGRYACMILMWLPLLIGKFGFGSVIEMVLYPVGNGLLLIAYWLVYARYMKKRSAALAITLAVLPSCIFLLSGLLLRHRLLVAFAVLFAVSHILITRINTEIL